MTIDHVVLALGPHSALACIASIIVATAAIYLSRLHPTATTRATPQTRTVGARPGPTELITTASSHGLRALTTAQLCGALQRSYTPTNDLPGQTDWTRLLMREELLGEMERRNPAGFNRWLTTTPSPGDDPSRYLTPDQ